MASAGEASRKRRWAAVLPSLAALVCLAAIPEAADRTWLTGKKLDDALRLPVSVFREAADLREMLDRLADIRQTAYVLDRRIDPSQTISLKLQQSPLRLAFKEVAAQADAVCCPLGATLVIGRSAEIDRYLTQAEVLQTALKQDRAIPSARRVALLRARDIRWADLDTPREVVTRIVQDWDLKVDNLEEIPHDLWASGTAVGVDAVQALSLVLGQFGLSFEWARSAKSIRIVPLPANAAVERTHRPKEMSAAGAMEVILAEWPQAETRLRGTAISVTATVLEHEAIAVRIGETPELTRGEQEPVPLSRRRFPVRIVRKPVGDILAAMRQQGIDVDYDPQALTAAGINLQTLVTLEFENATAEELFDALCRPARLTYEIDGATVHVRPHPQD